MPNRNFKFSNNWIKHCSSSSKSKMVKWQAQNCNLIYRFIENVYHLGNIFIYTFVQFKGLNNIEPNHVSSQAMLGKLFWSWNVSSLKALCFIGINIHVILADSLISFVKIACICTICQSLIFTANHLYNFNEWLGLEFFVSYWLVECPPLLFLCLLLIWVSIHCVEYNLHSNYQRGLLTNEWLVLLLCSQLKLSHPEHVLVKRVSSAEESFDRALQSFSSWVSMIEFLSRVEWCEIFPCNFYTLSWLLYWFRILEHNQLGNVS